VARFADALPEGDTGAILSAFFFSPPVVSHEWRRTDSRGLKAFCAREEAMKSKAINMAAVEMRRIFIMRSKFLKLAPERQNLNFGDEWSNLAKDIHSKVKDVMKLFIDYTFKKIPL
jgi:hypothetical protein